MNGYDAISAVITDLTFQCVRAPTTLPTKLTDNQLAGSTLGECDSFHRHTHVALLFQRFFCKHTGLPTTWHISRL